MPYWATWYEIRCWKCECRYFVCDGDTNDMSAPDIGRVKCPSCGCIESLEEDDIAEESASDLAEVGVLMEQSEST